MSDITSDSSPTTGGNFNNNRSKKKSFHGGGLELNNHFMEWWSEARKSEEPPTPYEFLTNFGIGFDDNEHMRNMFWSSVLRSIPKYGANYEHPKTPGCLDYYAHYLKDGCKAKPLGYLDLEWSEDDHIFDELGEFAPLQAALSDHYDGGITEQDLKSSIEVIPPDGSDLTHFIYHTCSLTMVNCVFEAMPKVDYLLLTLDRDDGYRNEYDRQALDKDLVLTLQKHIGKIKSIQFGSEYCGGDYVPWTKDGFRQCLHMMIQSECPPMFAICVPDIFVDGENDINISPTLPNQKVVGKGIGRATIHFSRKNEDANLALLDIIPFLGGLQALSLDVGPHLKKASPYLVRYLQSATSLKTISIKASAVNEPHVWHDSLDILEALKRNSSLKIFQYDGECRAEMESKMLEILQEHNTTLQEMQLGGGLSCRVFVKAVRKQIDYFLMLNEYGRGRARMPSLQLVGFVALLDEANKSLGYYQKKALSVIFGLLQERPDLWTKASSSATIGYKRKGSNQEVGQQKQRKMC